MNSITYEAGGFTFTLTLDINGNVVVIQYPYISPQLGPGVISENPSIPVSTAITIINALLGG